MTIIGISALARSGKDTFANFIMEQPRTIKIALADPIKRYIAELWGFSDDDLWGPSENRNKEHPNIPGLTPRSALQQIGTNICRSLDEDVYSRFTIKVAKTLLNEGNITYIPQKGIVSSPNTAPYEMVIVSDARFYNELSFIQKSGGKIIRIKRDGAGLKGEEAAHQSESEMLKMPDSMFDVVVENNGTLEDLKIAADKTVSIIKSA